MKRLTTHELRQRIDALDTLRLTRRLTAAEQAEADNLGHRLYMRAYRGCRIPAPVLPAQGARP